MTTRGIVDIANSMNTVAAEFKPGVYYNRYGNSIEADWENVPTVSKYKDKYITLRRDGTKKNPGRVVGVILSNIKHLISKDAIGIRWEDKSYGEDHVDEHLTLYRDDKKRVIGVKITGIEALIKGAENEHSKTKKSN